MLEEEFMLNFFRDTGNVNLFFSTLFDTIELECSEIVIIFAKQSLTGIV